MRFDGWIPNVAGHLSFSAIGGSSHPSKCATFNDDRYVCIAQTRDLLDIAIPYTENYSIAKFFRENFANLVIGISGKFCFVTSLSRSDSEEHIEGYCYIIPQKGKNPEIRKMKNSIRSMVDVEEIDDATKDGFNLIAKNLAISTSRISISRSGHIKITLQTAHDGGDQETDQDSDLAKLLANQIFYFFKDISHVHQHHDPKQDAITEVTTFDESDPNRWIEKTQNALYREVVRFKRFRNEKSLFRASGVLSYAQSFEISVAKKHNMERAFNSEEIKSSLLVSREELQHYDQKKTAELDTIRNWFFALFGMVISASFLVRAASPTIEISVDPNLVHLTQLVAESPSQVIIFVAMAAIGATLITNRRDPALFQPVRIVLRLLQGFRMRWYFVANALLTALLSWIFYLLLLKQFLS